MEKDEQKRIVSAARKAGYTVIAIPNEGKRGASVARDLRAMGLTPGVSDLLFTETVTIEGVTYKGIWLEMKRKGRKEFPNKTEHEKRQAEWLELMRNQGYIGLWASGAKEAFSKLKPFLPKLKGN